MAKVNRKRKGAIQQTKTTQKRSKIQAIATPPDSGDSVTFEPKSLQTIILDEELETTVDTLRRLTEYPNLIKSKPCKDLRAAVYDFRLASTTGSISAEGTNLTGRITAALVDEKFTDARIMLAEMKIRGQEPKLGALCRWVRDLDFISGLSKQADTVTDSELIKVLDSVLRVSCPVDTNPNAEENSSSSPICPQATWNIGPSTTTTPDPVYASVLDKSIFSGHEALAAGLRVVETIPGALRKPPNYHAAVLYTSAPNTVSLSPSPPPITYHKHPHVPHLGLATNVLSAEECRAIIAAGETVNFLPDRPISDNGDASVLAYNFYWVVDTDFHDKLWTRVSPHVPAAVGGRLARGLNRRFRVYRYVPGAEYRCHIDGAWPPSGIHVDDKYVYDDSPPGRRQSSLFTFLIYLNDEFEGGETTFFLPGIADGKINAYPVRPVMGGCAIFPHGEARGALLHEGTGVTKGAKYVIRTDVEYDVESLEQVP